MIPVTTERARHIALFGLGGSGMATALALNAGGARVTAFDDNPAKAAEARAKGIATSDFRQTGLAGYSELVLSPGVPLTHPKPHWAASLARAAGIGIIGDIELFCRERRAGTPNAPLVAITGTNGKSTTTALIAHILQSAGRDAQMGGNIGRAILSLEPLTASRIYVVECSSYQIDLSPSLDPDIGILLNLSPDHIDRHGDMENYAAIKTRLVAASRTAIVGVDDPHCEAVAAELAKRSTRVVSVSVTRKPPGGIYLESGRLRRAAGNDVETLIDLAKAPTLRGDHNAQNAAAAYAACDALGLSRDEIAAGMAGFPGLAHRMEQVARAGRVLFVNDSKATNADAAAMALASFKRIYWIAGGLPKEGGIEPLQEFFPRIAKAYLIGEAAPQFAATIGGQAPFEIAGTLDAAVKRAASDAASDKADEPVVLLSPACASFDQYANFEKRGDAFRAAVLALSGVASHTRSKVP